MTANHAWMLKGWLMAEHAPTPIMEAIESVIASLSHERPTGTVSGSTQPTVEIRLEPLPDDSNGGEQADPDEPEASGNSAHVAPAEPAAPIPAEEKKPRKKHTMSPENRAAAAERMRLMQAAKKAAREKSVEHVPGAPTPVETEFTEPELRITLPKTPPHKSSLTDADWPDIKKMLEDGRSRSSVASDYEEEAEDLDFFIASCQRREQRSGEALAPSHHGA